MVGFTDEQIKEQFKKEVTEKDVKMAVERSTELLKKVEAGFLKKEFAKIQLLIMMLNDYVDGVYKEVPWHTIVAIVIIILYILNPLDLIPDFIPLLGQLDDLAVLYFGWRLICEDVKEYANWKIKNTGCEKTYELYEKAFS
ncbi:MAG: YkvA family protein [Candidatus Kryptonium sp.]